MPRPRKAGLDYFYKGVHDWDDLAIAELVGKYGPMGYCVYDVVLSKVYENGYYLEISLDRLSYYVMKTIGNRWIKDKDFVLQVMKYCAEIGLFDHALLSQSVITSTEIQMHYDEVTARSKADKTKYWLLGESDDDGDPAADLNLPADEVFTAETPVFAEKTRINAANTPQSKANQTKQKQSKESQSKAKPDAAAADCSNEIEEAFFDICRREFKATDRAALEEMYALGADNELIISVMSEIAGRGNHSICSMRYFLPKVRESLQKQEYKSQSPSQNQNKIKSAAKDYYESPKSNESCGRCPETSNIDDVEKLLDEEWIALVSRYE